MTKNDLSYWNTTINALQGTSNISDLNRLHTQYSKNITTKKREELKTIYTIILAKKLSEKQDKLCKESIQNIEKVNKLLLSIDEEALITWTHSQMGSLYYTYNYYENALQHFLISSRNIEQTANEQLLDASEILKQHSYFYFTIKDYKNNKYYLERALLVTDEKSPNYGSFLNALGNCYFELNNYSKAVTYYNKTLLNSKNNSDTLRYAKALGDLAKIYIKNKDYKKAESLLIEDITLSKILNEDRNRMFAELRLGSLYLEMNASLKAKEVLMSAQAYARTKSYLQGYNYDLSKLLLTIVAKENNVTEELKLRRLIDSLRPIIEPVEGIQAIDKINWTTQKEKIVWKLEAEKATLQKNNILILTILIVVISILGFLILVWKNTQKRMRLEHSRYENIVLNHKLRQLKSEQQLEKANNSLKSFHTYLTDKQQHIDILEHEIDQLKLSNLSKDTVQKTNLEGLLHSHLITQEKWWLFKKAFIAEQTNYYKSLIAKYPNLTDSNLRIILLHKLELNHNEVAKLLGITVDAVKKSKQRLSKKYNVPFDTFLNCNSHNFI